MLESRRKFLRNLENVLMLVFVTKDTFVHFKRYRIRPILDFVVNLLGRFAENTPEGRFKFHIMILLYNLHHFSCNIVNINSFQIQIKLNFKSAM